MPIPILSGLSEIARHYDALICDVWGVLHNGRKPFLPAVDCCYRFRAECGPVILLTNAPRPVADVEGLFRRVGVPLDCYDAILSSGVLAREDLERRIASAERTVRVYHLGPDRDGGVLGGLDIQRVDLAQADIVVCTGLYDDETESPDDYAERFAQMKARNLVMLCVNPDIVVQRGDKLIWCAGALAAAYEKIGGDVIYYGKPHPPIYRAAMEAARNAGGRRIVRPLAIGDGADTDIKGANSVGLDSVFVMQGVHSAQFGDVAAEGVAQLFAVPRCARLSGSPRFR